MTISRSGWWAMSIWDIEDQRKVCQWNPTGAIFTRFALNIDPNSAATVAISLRLDKFVPNFETLRSIPFVEH